MENNNLFNIFYNFSTSLCYNDSRKLIKQADAQYMLDSLMITIAYRCFMLEILIAEDDSRLNREE